MQNDDQKFIATFRSSPIGEKFVADLESARVERKRTALKSWAALAKTEADFWAKFRAGEAEIADRRKAFEAAETALREAGSALYVATRSLDDFRIAREREEGAARAAVLHEANPRRQEVLFEPIRRAIEESRAARVSAETKNSDRHYSHSGAPVPEQFLSSRPSILARIEFLQRSLNLANETMFAVADDSDDTLVAIREAILSAAPSVERMVNIPLTRDGARLATDQEITSAIAKAEDLAAKHFGVVLREAK
jgi:hypothetical protein